GFATGAVVAAVAMIGDLISSFLKRRLKIQPSGMALGLDQIPESLLPAIAAACTLPVTVWDVVAVTTIFFAGELILSRILFALKVRDRPY
ncbi:MAG: CDP-archaeol synthase, partial [Methylocystis sp.]|nr:CDP-archaeol synthase [Methylocystis sp.]